MTWARRACSEGEAFIWAASTDGSQDIPASVLYYHVQSAIYAPLLCAEQPLGVVYVDNYGTPQAFTPADLELLSAIANQAAMFVKNHELRQELQREAAIRSNLLRQFSPKVAERLLQKQGRLRLGGQRVKPVTILLSDVRSFTSLTARLPPDEVVQMLNEVFGLSIPIIFKYDGTVDKYVGDAILAVFGSPEPDDQQWEKAVRAALEMQRALGELAQRQQRIGRPAFRVGIGIHSGEVLHGFIGAPERMEYTVIGDAVNRTERYCRGADRDEIIISQTVYERIFHLVEVESRRIQAKHRHEPDLDAYVVNSLKENMM